MPVDQFELIRRVLSVLSGVFVFLFYVAVARDALRKIITPNPTSWLIWSLNDSLILFASLSAGAFNTLAVPLVYSIFGWFVVAAALRNKRRRPNRLETFCLVGAAVGWFCFLLSFGSFVSLLISVAVNTIGAAPTIIRVSRDPAAERFRPWLLVWIGSALSLASLERWDVSLILFPIDSLILCSLVLLFICRGGAVGGASRSPRRDIKGSGQIFQLNGAAF